MENRSESGTVIVAIILAVILLLVAGGLGFYLVVGRHTAALTQAEQARLAEEARMQAERARAEAEAAAASRRSSAEIELPTGQGDSIRAAVESILRAQQDAWNRGDLDAFMEHYTKSDSLTFSSGGKTTRGWAETLNRYRERYPTPERMGRLEFSGLEITPLGDSVALVLGQWRVERDSEPIAGNFSLVVRMVNNRWLIIHDHTSRLTEYLALTNPLAVTAAEPAAKGTVAGVVRFTGTVPKPKVISTTDGSTIEHSDLLVDPKTKGLRYVIVTLEDAPEQPKAKEAKPVVVDQVHWVFQPRVVAVQHGQAVRFDNSDNVNHSVMAISTVAKNRFNTVAGPGSPVTHTFEPQETPVLIGCSLHGWMRAWVHVSRHPWFDVSDAQGKFEISQIPPGKYALLLHHPDTNLRERKPIEIKGSQTLEVTIEWNKVGKKAE